MKQVRGTRERGARLDGASPQVQLAGQVVEEERRLLAQVGHTALAQRVPFLILHCLEVAQTLLRTRKHALHLRKQAGLARRIMSPELRVGCINNHRGGIVPSARMEPLAPHIHTHR